MDNVEIVNSEIISSAFACDSLIINSLLTYKEFSSVWHIQEQRDSSTQVLLFNYSGGVSSNEFLTTWKNTPSEVQKFYLYSLLMDSIDKNVYSGKCFFAIDGELLVEINWNNNIITINQI